MSIIDLVQGVYFALKTITKTIKGKGENDLLTKELLISIDSIIETLVGLRENGLITNAHRVACQNLYEAAEEVTKAVTYYLCDCSSFYRALNESTFRTQFDALRVKMDSRLAQLTVSLAAGNSAKLTKILDNAAAHENASR